MTPNTRPHYQQIADAIYAERRAECDPLAVLEWEAEHGDEAHRVKAIAALREWENNTPSPGLSRLIFGMAAVFVVGVALVVLT